MKKLKIAICDDERVIRDEIERLIKILYPNFEIIKLESGDALLKFQGEIDILFLDIQMKGTSGMEAARKLRTDGKDVSIIFVTAMEEYVFEAFDVGAFHYLVKPINKVKFYQVLKKAVEERSSLRTNAQPEEPGILVKTGKISRKVPFGDILYLEVINRRIIIHMKNERIEIYGKLSELESNLGSSFMRCHRSFIVSLRYIQEYDCESITLEDGTSIPLAKQKYGDFVKAYMKYMEDLNK